VPQILANFLNLKITCMTVLGWKIAA